MPQRARLLALILAAASGAASCRETAVEEVAPPPSDPVLAPSSREAAEGEGEPSRLAMGAALFPLSAGANLAQGLPDGRGLFVGYVYRDGPAARAGIMRGDILLSLDGRAMDNLASYRSVLNDYDAGETIAGEVWRRGAVREITIEPQEVITVFRQACEEGDAEGCFELGAKLEARSGGEDDWSEAVGALEKGCSGGSPSACINLGIAYSNGELGLGKDDLQAAALYERACDQRVSQGCFNLARLHAIHARENGPLADAGRALEIYAQTCSWGDAEGCVQAAKLSASLERARPFWERACHLGHPPACKQLELNATAARALQEKQETCDGGNLQDCVALSYQYASGSKLGQDMRKAIQLARQACEGGVKPGCEQMLWYQGMSCVWDYRILREEFVDGFQAADADECVREATRHVAATCAERGWGRVRVSGTATFRAASGQKFPRPLPRLCDAVS